MIGVSYATTPPSAGPRYDEEAPITWKKANQKRALGQFSQAAWLYRRITSRYPGFKYYHEAHLRLGLCELANRKWAEAIEPLKYYAHYKGYSKLGLQARVHLGNAYLGVKKNHEALLLSKEILDRGVLKKNQLTPEIKLGALLLKTQALIALKRNKRAQSSFDAYESLLNKNSIKENLVSKNEITSKGGFLKVVLKLHICESYPTQEKLSEEATRDQLQWRGRCHLESLNLAFESFKRNDNLKWFKPTLAKIKSSILNYGKYCLNPPSPTGKLSPIELKRYRDELVQILKKDCKKILNEAQRIVGSWYGRAKVSQELTSETMKLEKGLRKIL